MSRPRSPTLGSLTQRKIKNGKVKEDRWGEWSKDLCSDLKHMDRSRYLSCRGINKRRKIWQFHGFGKNSYNKCLNFIDTNAVHVYLWKSFRTGHQTSIKTTREKKKQMWKRTFTVASWTNELPKQLWLLQVSVWRGSVLSNMELSHRVRWSKF